jgi:hypothetical protein
VTCTGEQAAESLAQVAELFRLGFHELSK